MTQGEAIAELIEAARHAATEFDNLDVLKSAGFYIRDPATHSRRLLKAIKRVEVFAGKDEQEDT